MRKTNIIFLLATGLFFALLTSFVTPYLSVVALGLLLLLVFFFFHFDYGVYLLVLLTPFVYLQVVWRDFNVPISDLLAMVIFLAWCARVLTATDISLRKLLLKSFPAILYFLIFIATTLFSFTISPSLQASVKYLFRPLIFFYLMFVVVPYVSIDNATILRRVIKVSYWLGIIVAGMGLFSFVFPQNAGILWRRAIPVSIFGTYPLGTNHNLIAEVLVTIIPLGFALAKIEPGFTKKKAYLLGTLGMIGICLLTFSRAGWLVLGLQGVLAVFLRYRHNIEKLFLLTLIFFLLLIPLSSAMYLFSQTFIVSSSNTNRILLTQTAITAWQDHPWRGNGLNTFISFVEQNTEYVLEFGAPLDSHGVVQKLMVEVGLLGTAAFFIFIIALFAKLRDAYRTFLHGSANYSLLIASSLAALGIVVFELFNTSYFIGKMWLPIGIALAAAKLVKREHYEREERLVV